MYNGPIRKKLRLKNYDYSQNGFYFVTICTKNKEDFFGEIIDGKMFLNEYAKIAEKEILKTEELRKEIKIDEFIIMPNHLHLIIVINNENIVGNDYYHSENIGNENIRSLRANLSNVIKGFKIGCTKEIRNNFNDFTFGWQKSFFDKVIKNDEQLQKTRQYIINNPLKWEFDVNNKNNEELIKKLRKEKNKS